MEWNWLWGMKLLNESSTGYFCRNVKIIRLKYLAFFGSYCNKAILLKISLFICLGCFLAIDKNRSYKKLSFKNDHSRPVRGLTNCIQTNCIFKTKLHFKTNCTVQTNCTNCIQTNCIAPQEWGWTLNNCIQTNCTHQLHSKTTRVIQCKHITGATDFGSCTVSCSAFNLIPETAFLHDIWSNEWDVGYISIAELKGGATLSPTRKNGFGIFLLNARNRYVLVTNILTLTNGSVFSPNYDALP